MTRRRFVQIAGELVEVAPDYTPEPRADHHVIADIAPFTDTTGALIRGRAHWREHLKATGTQELGHSDIAAQQREHAKRREAHQARMSAAAAQVREAPQSAVLEARVEHSRIAANVANRLHGRPQPDRKTLIKIALQEAKRSR